MVDTYTVPRDDHRRRVQAVGAAISRRDWGAVEQAHAEIRDAFDRPDVYDSAALSAHSTGSAGVAAEPSEAALHAAMGAFYPGEDWRTALGRALDTSLRDMMAALKAAQAVDGAGVAAEPVAWAWERLICGYTQPDAISRWVCEASTQKPEPHYLLRNIRPLYDHPPVAAAPTPPAGGGETEAADAVAASVAASARRASEGLGLLKAAASACAARKATIAHAEPPALPAGDLISLSAGAIRTLEGLERIRCSSHVSDEVVTAQDASKLIRALLNPAAPRKGPSEEEIAKLAPCSPEEIEAWEQWAAGEGFDMHEHPLHYLFLETHTAAARKGWKAGLAFAASTIAPEDRGETQAVGAQGEPVADKQFSRQDWFKCEFAAAELRRAGHDQSADAVLKAAMIADEAPAAPRPGSGVSVETIRRAVFEALLEPMYADIRADAASAVAPAVLALIAQAPRDGGETQGGIADIEKLRRLCGLLDDLCAWDHSKNLLAAVKTLETAR